MEEDELSALYIDKHPIGFSNRPRGDRFLIPMFIGTALIVSDARLIDSD